ncbi:glutamate--tRNA ligase [Rhodobacterales bacterium 52_120_T64]|nr:glutamate--tRNA ligase [Rhodobacterales bacterium 52_120_T64]
MSNVVTRFAPSPTGFLHIGSARTALFNWLFARNQGGKFLLRIEDTDRKRYTPEAVDAIYDGMRWLGLDWDEEPISQFSRVERHAEVAHEMLAKGAAYKCYSTKEEIDAFRTEARAAKRPPLFRSPWRDADLATAPDAPYVVRLKAPREGETTINDQVQGSVTWKNETLDDMILLRSDGTPTYMLAVVVDDYDMGVTHVIRGDDHLTNAARQSIIYTGMGWDLPIYAHIPLIHGPDGAKLSKRHGALGVDAYRDMGYLPAAMRNYLARLGWSHGDEDFFTTAQAIEWFGLDKVGKSPARFDFKKLENLSGQHIRATDNVELLKEIEKYVASQHSTELTSRHREMFIDGMDSIKERAKIIPELLEIAYYFLGDRPFKPDEKAGHFLTTVSRGMLNRLTSRLRDATWTLEELEAEIRAFAEVEDLKLGKVAQPLRVALTGRTVSPSVFDMMVQLGKVECIARLEDASR